MKRLKWDFHCCWMPEVSFRLCTAESSWPLISQPVQRQHSSSASTNGCVLYPPPTPEFVSFSFFLFCFFKGTKSNVGPLFPPHLHISEKSGQAELIHISTCYVYKRIFLFPQWKCLFSFKSSLSVPELVPPLCEYFFFPPPYASSFSDDVLIITTAQHSSVEALSWEICFIWHNRICKKTKLKSF